MSTSTPKSVIFRTHPHKRFHLLPKHAQDVMIDCLAKANVMKKRLEFVQTYGCSEIPNTLGHIDRMVTTMQQMLTEYTGIGTSER